MLNCIEKINGDNNLNIEGELPKKLVRKSTSITT
jgi:hypothetical protein